MNEDIFGQWIFSHAPSVPDVTVNDEVDRPLPPNDVVEDVEVDDVEVDWDEWLAERAERAKRRT